MAAKAQRALATAPARSVEQAQVSSAESTAVGATAIPGNRSSLVAEPTHHSAGTLVRFLGLLTLFVIAVGSLVFAITQNSLGGIVWMAVTTAITGICFYFALQEFSGSRHVQNR